MKRILAPFFTIIIIFISIIFLQSQDVRTETWHYEGLEVHPDWDLEEKTYYSYDSIARIIEEIKYSVETEPASLMAKRSYIYDVVDRLSEINEYIYEEGVGWEPKYKFRYEYDAYSNIIQDETWTYYGDEINKDRLEYTYDSSGNLLYEAFASYSPGWGFYPQYELSYTYDNNNNLIKEEYSDGGGGDRVTYTYDDLSRRITDLIQVYDYYGSGELENLTLETYFYTGDNLNRDSTRFQLFNTSISDWKNFRFYIYDYTSSDLLDKQEILDWEESLGMYVNYLRYSYFYDDNENLIERIRESYTNNEWKNSIRFSETFNNDNLTVEKYTEQFWDSDNLIWYGNEHELYEYDIDNNLIVEEFKIWDTGLFGYKNEHKDVHYWSDYNLVSIEDTKDDISCFFSNPYIIGTHVSCEALNPNFVYTFNVHDFAGRKIYQKSFSGSQELSLRKNIPKGVYVFSIKDKQGNNIYTNKLVVNN